ncbi:hypothetical protein MBLNU230_g7292t1 [Neophaeotheca triangularis]
MKPGDEQTKTESTPPFEDGQQDTTAPELTLRSGLATAGATIVYLTTVGLLNAFGVFQQLYTELMPDKSAFDISWIGSFAIFMAFGCAPIAGFTADKYGPRLPMAIGAFCMLVAIFTLSLCTDYYQFFLAQGLLLGFGMSLMAVPSSGIVPRYFNKYRAAATGVSITGSSIGGVMWPIVLNQLFNRHGLSFAWCIRIVGFIMIPLQLFALLTVRPPSKAKPETPDNVDRTTDAASPKKRNLSGIKSAPFMFLCAGLALIYFGFFSPYFYITTYSIGLGISPELAFYMPAIINGASTFGRIVPGFLADRWGRFNTLVVAGVLSALVAFCWTTADGVAGVAVWGAAYGFVSGSIMSLQIACATSLTLPENAGAAIGAILGSVSLTGLFGPPISGELVKHGYMALSCYSAAMILGGTVFVVLARIRLSATMARVV